MAGSHVVVGLTAWTWAAPHLGLPALEPLALGLTTIGALYLVVVCLLPEILISKYNVPFYFGGTSLMIVVSVTMDTVTQIQSQLLAHQYEGLIKKARVKGRAR